MDKQCVQCGFEERNGHSLKCDLYAPSLPTFDDLKPFKHGEEGTHSACQKNIMKGCCECLGHDCSEVPMGVSQWAEHGKKYGYWEFFEEQIRADERKKVIKKV